MKIKILYQCQCLTEEVGVEISARGSIEVIEGFMHRCTAAVTKDHVTRSPLCRSRTITVMKIPVNDKGEIGRP